MSTAGKLLRFGPSQIISRRVGSKSWSFPSPAPLHVRNGSQRNEHTSVCGQTCGVVSRTGENRNAKGCCNVARNWSTPQRTWNRLANGVVCGHPRSWLPLALIFFATVGAKGSGGETEGHKSNKQSVRLGRVSTQVSSAHFKSRFVTCTQIFRIVLQFWTYHFC